MAKVNIKVLRGIRINGVSVFPKTDVKGKKVQTVLTVEDRFAEQVVAASKAEITKDKANYTLPKPKDDLEAELEAAE